MSYTTNIKTFKQQAQDEIFYSTMGKFFAFRDFALEMGGWQFYNKKNSTWFLLYINNDLAGFCAIFEEKTHIFFDNFYILKQFRGMGLSRILFDFRIDYCKNIGKEMRSITDNPFQEKNYKRNGFAIIGKRGHYNKWSKK